MLAALRIASRRMFLEKKFSFLTVGMMAVGIGASVSAFSVLDAIVLRPLPYLKPWSLVAISSASRERGIEDANVSMGDFVYWRERSRTLEEVAALGYAELVLTGRGEPERIATAAVSWNFLKVLGIHPLIGRDFLPREETPGLDQVVLLSHELWQRRFGGDPKILGATLTLSGYSYQIIGVMPPDFRHYGQRVGFWSPMAIDQQNIVRQRRGIQVIGRLRPGMSLKQAQEEMRLLSRELAREFPATNAGWTASVTSLQRKLTRTSQASVVLTFIAALTVLGLAVGNMASMMVAQSLGRRQETLIRKANGAQRLDLIRPQLFENLLLSCLGCGAGLVVAHASLALVISQTAFQVPRLNEARLGLSAISFALSLSIGIAVVLSLAPLYLDRPAAVLRHRGGSASERLAEGIVVVEISLAFLLLIASVLLLRSFLKVTEIDAGFDPGNVIVIDLSVPVNKYPDGQHQLAFFNQLIERMREMPEVKSAAASSNVPLNGAALNIDIPVTKERTRNSLGREERADLRLISPDYFSTLKIPLKAGRDFTAQDGKDAKPVALVNETLARRLWPSESPVGKPIHLSYEGEKDYEVVGVVGNVRHRGAEKEVGPEVFLAYRQHPQFFASLVVRPRSGVGAMKNLLKSVVWNLDRDQDMTISTMAELVEEHLLPRRFLVTQLGVLSGVALLIAVLGVFSMISLAVQRRGYEIGVRMALGARKWSVVGVSLGRALRLAGFGLGLGLAVALLGSQYFEKFLFKVKGLDPWSLLSAIGILLIAALAGSYFPARRAVEIDPVAVLRKG